MPIAIFFLLLGVASLAAPVAILTLHRNHRLKARLLRQYGQPPEILNGLKNAEDFWASQQKAMPAHQPAARDGSAHSAPFHVDNLTWSDLDLDDIYARFNACQCAAGDVRLYTALRRLDLGAEAGAALEAREALIRLFSENATLRGQVRYQLARLGRFDGANLRDGVFHADTLALRHRWLYPILGLLPLLAIPLFWTNPVAATVLLLALISANFATDTFVRGRAAGGFRAVRYLAGSLNCARRLAALLHAAAPDTAAALRAHAARFGRLRPGIALLSFDNMLESNIDFDPLCLIMLPMMAYGSVAARLAGSGPQTLALYTLLGEVDLAQGLASTRESLPLWCRPVFTEERLLEAKNLYHPMLDDPVANSAAFGNDVLFTGSNASGKSTFIKALAIGCITAQALNTCTAQGYTLRRGAVATSMAVADSVVDGDSYFVAEIKSMRRLIELAGGVLPDVEGSEQNARPAARSGSGAPTPGCPSPAAGASCFASQSQLSAHSAPFSYFFIDEILKGTNTVERVAASSSVLHFLHNASCLCFAATHDIELTAILAGAYDNYHFRETVTPGGVHFDYSLHPGPAATRNAILLLERMGYPPAVTENARALVARFEARGDWADPPA